MNKKENVDILFITNVPAFYKINLYNELAKKINIHVIFISNNSNIRNSDFTNGQMLFKYTIINNIDFEKRNKLITLFKIISKIKNINYKIIIYPGWEIKELFILSLLLDKKRNAIAIESSILESDTTGLKKIIKKIYITRMSKAYPSGSLQLDILTDLKYQGEIYITHGVGIPNNAYSSVNTNNKTKKIKKNTDIIYLYVGRLSPEKNLELLIHTFNILQNTLYIVGSGDDESKLKVLANSNIKFLGYINNNEIKNIYLNADVFILPSKTEPWGLVIDEAILYNLPVIISDRVGCKDNLLLNNNGIIFNYNDENNLLDAITLMNNNYKKYYENTLKIDINNFYHKQINAYIESINNEEK